MIKDPSNLSGPTRLKPTPTYSTYRQGAVPVHSASPFSFTTAREKHRSIGAEDAAEAVREVDRSVRQQHPTRFHQAAALKTTMSVPLTSSSSGGHHHGPRGNKTLGWFLADNDIFDKKTSSMKTDSGCSSATKSPSDEKKRRRGARRGSKKSDYVPGQAPSEGSGSVASEDYLEDVSSSKQRVVPELAKEDFWYYDVASDGYYYEQNGAKGWRRRMPNSAMQKIKEQEMAQLAASSNIGKMAGTSSSATSLPASSMGSMPSAQAQAQAAAQAALLQSALFSQPALKYYDPSSDGFFYEMASVDGWKRRQPSAAPSSAPGMSSAAAAMSARAHSASFHSRPSAMTTSYGAALARGQMPRNCVIDDSSASSSVSEDTVAQDPFGLEAGFQLADLVSRPDSLNFHSKNKGREQMMPEFNADQFIQDLSFSGMDPSKVLGVSTRNTPSDAWSARCGGWSESSSYEAPQSPEEESMGLLLKGLENIWATPTPVKQQL